MVGEIRSKNQVRRMKKLIVNQIDKNCNAGSTFAYHSAVNRPLQTIKVPNVWCCNSKHWTFNKLKENKDDWLQRQSEWHLLIRHNT